MAARGNQAAAGYLSGLNPEQQAAVETLDGPVLVLAGAGTGKTRVLTTRIAHILNQRRAFPSEILAVTFTNKAAREMKERIAHLVGETVEGMPWLGTFHATGVKILRRHAELVGLKPGFTILYTDDQIRLLKQLIQAEDIDEKRWPARVLASAIDGWKNRALTPDKVPAGEAAAYANGLGLKLYADYQARLSGPLIDRIDLHIAVPAVSAADLLLPPPAEGSREVRARVARARAVQAERYAALGLDDIRVNAQAQGPVLEEVARADAAGLALLREAAETLQLSARGYHRVLRVARTLADLDGAADIRRGHLAEALSYRAGADARRRAA